MIHPLCPNCEEVHLDRFGECSKCGYKESEDAELLSIVEADCPDCGMPPDLCDCDREELVEEWETSLRIEEDLRNGD